MCVGILEDSAPGSKHTGSAIKENENNNFPNALAAPWWTAECNRLLRVRKGAFKKLREFYSRKKYKRIEKQTKFKLRKIKKNNFERLRVDSLNALGYHSFLTESKVSTIGLITQKYDLSTIKQCALTTFESICPLCRSKMRSKISFDDGLEDPFLDLYFTWKEAILRNLRCYNLLSSNDNSVK